MTDLSPTMLKAIRSINGWYENFGRIPYMVGDVGVRWNTVDALERRGICKVTNMTLNDEYIDVLVIKYEDWHPGVLDRLARL